MSDDGSNIGLEGLSSREQNFVLGYVGGYSASEAYRLAGWECSDASLAAAASRKLHDVKIQDAVGKLRGGS